jgi:large subunit ribosomal protein L6
MSRIGKQPIDVPDGVKVDVAGGAVHVKGPKGSLSRDLPSGITCTLDGKELKVERQNDSRRQRALHGLTRTLIANAVKGTSEAFQKKLEIVGVGYRAEAKKGQLELALGFSHPVIFPIPEGIDVQVEKQTRLTVTGIDKQQVGQVAADIRALKPPEPYKGKGIRYEGELIKRKAGKAAVGSGA